MNFKYSTCIVHDVQKLMELPKALNHPTKLPKSALSTFIETQSILYAPVEEILHLVESHLNGLITETFADHQGHSGILL